MKTKLLFLFPLLALACACNANQNQSASNQEGGESQSGDQSTSYDPEQLDIVNIAVSGETFMSAFSQGTNFDGSSNEGNRTNLKNYFNRDVTIVDSLSVTGKVTAQKYDLLQSKHALTIGSGASTGELSLNFTKTVVKIEVSAQSYWQTYNSGCFYDLDSKLKVTAGNDNQQLDLLAISPTGDNRDENNTYATGTLSLNCQSTSAKFENLVDEYGRVTLLSISLTYVK